MSSTATAGAALTTKRPPMVRGLPLIKPPYGTISAVGNNAIHITNGMSAAAITNTGLVERIGTKIVVAAGLTALIRGI